ncbi:MAG TPA: dUTP diphosphatase [Solirubrobacteraceae bacterium]|nr:dUTP diphosphatase [Solirubrobacteraceae bacterium]
MEAPARAYAGDAGLDLSARTSATLDAAGGPVAVATGLAVAIPPGHVGLVCPRSGLALREGITVVNAPGVIDSGYRGEIMVILHRVTPGSYEVRRGDRIAQLLVVPAAHDLELVVSPELPETERHLDGLGSSGR